MAVAPGGRGPVWRDGGSGKRSRAGNPAPGGGKRGRPAPPETGTKKKQPAETEGSGGWGSTGQGDEFSLLPLGLGWEGSIFNGDAGKRFAWILFILLTYRLAFGRNERGENYVESGINSAADLYGRGYGYRQEPKKTRAILKANLAGVSVAKRSAKKTSRKLAATRSAPASRRAAASREARADTSREARAEKQPAQDQVSRQRAAKRGRDKTEARSGLMNLGYSRTQANQMLAQAGDQASPEAYIQAALKERGKSVQSA